MDWGDTGAVADADRNPIQGRIPVRDGQGFNDFDNLARDALRTVAVGLGQDDCEFFTAKPGHQISRPARRSGQLEPLPSNRAMARRQAIAGPHMPS